MRGAVGCVFSLRCVVRLGCPGSCVYVTKHDPVMILLDPEEFQPQQHLLLMGGSVVGQAGKGTMLKCEAAHIHTQRLLLMDSSATGRAG
eukprot:32953-Pelagomonas_calceolata.AAC.1